MNALPRCSRHAGARAGWRCRGCQAALCPGCVFVRVAGTTELVSCCRCGGIADPLTLHRAELGSFASRLPGTWAALFTPGGLLTIVASAAVLWLLGCIGCLGALLRLSVLWALIFAAVRQASRGQSGLEPPDLSDVFHDLFRPAFMGVLATSLVWVPAVVWLLLRPGGLLAPVAFDPVLLLIAVASVLYVPMALLHAAVGGGLFQMLNPVAIGGAAIRLGGDYLLAVGVACLSVVANLALVYGGSRVLGNVPILSGVLREGVGLLAPLLLARSLGLLLYVRGDAVGLGPPEDYLDPVLPGAAPRGSAPARPAAEQQPPSATAEEAAGPAARIEAIELEPSAPEPASDAALIAADVARGDLASAAQRYAALAPPPAGIPAAVLFQLARGAAAAGNYPVAGRALQAAARSGEPAVAPDALLVLARICLQKLNRPRDARTILNQLLARYPQSNAARHGRQLLAQVPVA